MADAMKLGEVIETLEALTKSPGADEFDKGARAARLDALDMLRPLAASPPAREEAPAEGAGENGLHEMARKLFAAEYPGRNYDDLDPGVRIGWLGSAHVEILTALRNRTSEPEAGAVAWRWMWPETNQWHYADYDLHPEAEVNQPLYLHPAPATADKLRVAVEALEAIRDEARSWFRNAAAEHFGKLASDALAALNEGGE